MNSNDLAPVLIMGLGILAIIVRMLLVHQQKMTALVHQAGSHTANSSALENQRLEQEIADLKQLVMQQSIALDNLANKVGNSAPDKVQDRLTGVQ